MRPELAEGVEAVPSGQFSFCAFECNYCHIPSGFPFQFRGCLWAPWLGTIYRSKGLEMNARFMSARTRRIIGIEPL